MKSRSLNPHADLSGMTPQQIFMLMKFAFVDMPKIMGRQKITYITNVGNMNERTKIQDDLYLEKVRSWLGQEQSGVDDI